MYLGRTYFGHSLYILCTSQFFLFSFPPNHKPPWTLRQVNFGFVIPQLSHPLVDIRRQYGVHCVVPRHLTTTTFTTIPCVAKFALCITKDWPKSLVLLLLPLVPTRAVYYNFSTFLSHGSFPEPRFSARSHPFPRSTFRERGVVRDSFCAICVSSVSPSPIASTCAQSLPRDFPGRLCNWWVGFRPNAHSSRQNLRDRRDVFRSVAFSSKNMYRM
ncbi:hypothetical protein B0J11DRAFT_319853 [Dendryphion nanum]|uniref:Uncharacterized protein n=1 Tax=Dendryphion nanum TaxID=256645 RepID=A0A9P9DR10_9PLEO|nr:hypothetical protein B0J11DRAFT_319853 [Dendryphion nanum]